MQQIYIDTLDSLLRNAMEERKFEDHFAITLTSMTPEEHSALPALLVERWQAVSEQVGIAIRTPTLEQAQSFVASRLADLIPWNDDDDILPDDVLPDDWTDDPDELARQFDAAVGRYPPRP